MASNDCHLNSALGSAAARLQVIRVIAPSLLLVAPHPYSSLGGMASNDRLLNSASAAILQGQGSGRLSVSHTYAYWTARPRFQHSNSRIHDQSHVPVKETLGAHGPVQASQLLLYVGVRRLGLARHDQR